MNPLGSREVEYFAFLMLGTKFSPVPVDASPAADARVVDDETEGREAVETGPFEWLE
jgi:hypothetical protein